LKWWEICPWMTNEKTIENGNGPIITNRGCVALLRDRNNDWAVWRLKINFIKGAGIAQLVQRRATNWTAGVRFPAGEGDFSVLHSVHTVSLGPPKPLYNWCRGLSPLGWSGRGLKLTTDHHYRRGKECCSYTSIPPYVFMAWYLINEAYGQLNLFLKGEESQRNPLQQNCRYRPARQIIWAPTVWHICKYHYH
jgi:hypothetical protein